MAEMPPGAPPAEGADQGNDAILQSAAEIIPQFAEMVTSSPKASEQDKADAASLVQIFTGMVERKMAESGAGEGPVPADQGVMPAMAGPKGVPAGPQGMV